MFEGYRVTSPYGWRIDPLNHNKAFHEGIDLVKGNKEPIYAFVEGKVLHASLGKSGTGLGNYGNVVAIVDKNGHLHCYCHLDSCVVKVGSTVARGGMIGRQGSTGRSTGSHLHYEIRKTSKPSFGWKEDKEDSTLDPKAYLEAFYKVSKPVAKPAAKPAPKQSAAIASKGTIKIVNAKAAAFIVDRPSTTSENLGTIAKGHTINISGSVPGWWEVIYNGRRAYINAKYGQLQ